MLVGSSIFGIFAFYKQERTNSGMTEKELARLCKEGDEAARKVLYERYSKQMFGVCLRYAGHRAVAEDWLHDAFLKIYSTMDKFCYREEGSLKAWMMTVLHNCIIQHVRQPSVLEEAELMDEGMEVADEPYDDSLLGVDEGKIVAMVAQLPVGQRTVFNMFVFEGKSHREIAEALGIKEKTSSSQLFRARRSLAAQINAARRRAQMLWGGLMGLALVVGLTHYLYIRDTEKPLTKVSERDTERQPLAEKQESHNAKSGKCRGTSVPRYASPTVSKSVPSVAVSVGVDADSVAGGMDSGGWLAEGIEQEDSTKENTTTRDQQLTETLTPEDYLAILKEKMAAEAEGDEWIEAEAKRSKGWSLNVSVGVNGQLLSLNGDGTGLYVDDSNPSGADADPSHPGTSDPSGGDHTVDIPDGNPGENGGGDDTDNGHSGDEGNDGDDEKGNDAPRRMQALETPSDVVVASKNHRSWMTGISFRRDLGNRFSVETGITYTLLTSDVQFLGGTSWQHQQMHYVGIPLRADYDWLTSRRWTSYVTMGCEAERCIFGKQGSIRRTPSTWQWSVETTIGFRYNITPHVGFYLEPGVHYYFDNGVHIPTRRTETPFMFSVRFGLGLSY